MAHIAKYQRSAVGRMCEHYARVPELERGYDRDNIDRSRTGLNYNLCPEHDGGQVKFITNRIASLNLKRKPRKDAVTMCDLVLTAPQSLDQAREREFFESAYGFLAGKFGWDNVISAWVHMDETTPHMHFAWVPVTDDGRLSAKDVVNRPMLKALHGEMQRAIEADMGMHVEVILDPEKAADKALSDLGHAQYKAAKQEIEQTEKRLEGVQQKVGDAERRAGEIEREVAEARDRVHGLENQKSRLNEQCSRLEQVVKRARAAVRELVSIIRRNVGGIADVLGIDDGSAGERFAAFMRDFGARPVEHREYRNQNRDEYAFEPGTQGIEEVMNAAYTAADLQKSAGERSYDEWQR